MELHSTITGLDTTLASFDAIAQRCDDLAPPLTRLGQHHQRKIQRDLRSGSHGIQTRNASSGLASSMTYQVDANQLVVGSNKVYAASQQFGTPSGFIESSRPGGWLAIPIGDNVVARGNAKYDSPREVEDEPGRKPFFLRIAGNLFFVRARRAKPKKRKRKGAFSELAGAVGKIRQDLEFLFVLKKKVKAVAHHYASHDEPDQKRWDRFVKDWILKGQV